MTDKQLLECRKFLYHVGYGDKFCSNALEEEILEIMKSDYAINLKMILNKGETK
jgi:hypothetical protein